MGGAVELQPADAPSRRPEEQWTPSTAQEVIAVFAKHPSFQIPIAAFAALAAVRLQQPLGPEDAAVAVLVAGFWLVQEWVVHRHLLHSNFDWFGKLTHESHHNNPYYHVSLDPPELVVAVMGLAFAVFGLLFGGLAAPLALTATCAYIIMGVAYEWVHYTVHTRWVPRGNSIPAVWLRGVRRHHMLHHCRNENYWLAFTWPDVDSLFGTLPSKPDGVPMTPLARRTAATRGR